MQAKSAGYDECLESFSRPLLQVVDYTEHEDGSMTVHGETSGLYRYFDATRMAEDKLVRANRGVLSAARQSFFSMLRPSEIERLEQIVRDNLLTAAEGGEEPAPAVRPAKQTHSSSTE